jgi:hypothetical protein
VVRGYEKNHRGVEIGPYVASIDGGCGFGGSLCAVCFDAGGELIDSVEA